MSPEEKKRMIHIRIDDEVHKELRKTAAEYDLTIQEIVSGAVEDTIEEREMEIRLEKRRRRLERKARVIESRILDRAERAFKLDEKKLFDKEKELEISIEADLDEDDFERELPEAVMGKLMTMEKSIEKVSQQLEELKELLVQSEE